MTRISFLLFLLLVTVFSISQQTQTFSVYFAFDKFEVTEQEKTKIYSEVLPFVDSVKVLSIKIVGHTDHYSSNDYNQVLGLKRAASVKEILADFLPVTSSISSLGKSKPKYSNNTAKGQSSNRRVDIIIEYEENMTENVQYETDMLYPEKFENDTIIKFPEGVEFHIKAKTFYPDKIKDVTFITREVLSPYSAYRSGLSTMTADGRCLRSGGMIFTEAQIDGETINPNDSILVRIPANSIDTSMKLWDVKVVDGDTLWVESEMELSFSDDGNYYEFKTTTMPSINVDIPVVGGTVARIKGLFKARSTTIKSRGRSYVECYLVSNEELIVLEGELFKPKKSFFEPCLIDTSNIVIAHVQKRNKDFYLVNSLGEIKFKRFFNRYVIRKRDLKLIKSEEEYTQKVKETCENLSL